MRRQYELMQMKNNEKIAYFFNRTITHKNSVKNFGETVANKMIVKNILRTLAPIFDHIMVVIEESEKIVEMKVE